MPNISTTLYVSDDVFKNKYMPRKKAIMSKMREYIKKELNKPLTEEEKAENKTE